MKIKRVFLWMLVVLGMTMPAFAQDSGVSDARYARLTRGINLPYWFWYVPPTKPEIEARFSDDDFQLIHDLGFTFVRVPIDLSFPFDVNRDDLLSPPKLELIDSGIQRLLDHDLAVVVDLHSTSLEDSDAANYSGALEDPEFVEVFIRFWESFAAHLSQYDPDRVFLAPMNEPVFYDDPTAWLPIQQRLLKAIRAVAPEHTLLATSAWWSSREKLVEMSPLDDPNLIYDFHFYDPFVFTHQGTTWSSDFLISLSDVPYPSSPAAVQDAANDLGDGEARDQLLFYGQERWDAAKIDAEMARVAAWAAEHNVRLISTEFGAFSQFAPPADRVQWILDTRTAFEKYGIGWAMWEYDDSFGLVTRAGDERVVDVDVAEALGLNT